MIMERIVFINEVLKMENFDEKGSCISALVACLTPEDACNAVRFSRLEKRLQQYILRKIYNDIKTKRFLNIYQDFIEGLISDFSTQYKFAYVLDYFYYVVPDYFKNKIINLFT